MPLPPSPSVEDAHERAVQVFSAASLMWPRELASFALPDELTSTGLIEVQDAKFLDQPRGPRVYAVPDPDPATESDAEGTLRRALGELVAGAIAGESKLTVEPINIDFAEMRRQTLLEGGAPVELLLEFGSGTSAQGRALLGLLFPEPGSTGAHTPWEAMGHLCWQLTVLPGMLGEAARIPAPLVRPVYLWHGDGLEDPEETTSGLVSETGSGFLDGLMAACLDPERNRQANLERLKDLERKHEARLTAARRRAETMGDALIGDAELAALVPDVDLERDFVSMRLPYDALRLWERPLDALLEGLPAGCAALALFGYWGQSADAEQSVLRCAWSLRRRRKELDEAERLAAWALLREAATLWMPGPRAESVLQAFQD